MQILIQKAGPENLDAVLSLYAHLFSSDDINVLHLFKMLNPSPRLCSGDTTSSGLTRKKYGKFTAAFSYRITFG